MYVRSADMKVRRGWDNACAGAWNSFVEEKAVVPAEEDTRRRSSKSSQPSKLREVGTKEYKRIDTGISELNRVLGGAW